MRRHFGTIIVAAVLASCSDPLPPPGPPASIELITDAAITVPVMRAFPVRVLLRDASGRPVPDVPVIFELLHASPNAVIQWADTVRTDADGVATVEAATLHFSGPYQVIARVESTSVDPVVVNINATPDGIASVQTFPDTATIGMGDTLILSGRALDRFANVDFSAAVTIRSLTPTILQVVRTDDGRATIIGLAPGTGLIVAEHAQFSDTARVLVFSRVSVAMALGARHSCLLFDDGKVRCWGAVPNAGEVPANVRFDSIAAGGDQTCAVSGTALYCWGRGGAIPGGESWTPQRIPGGLSFARSFTVGRDHACATIDGVAYCWGDNSRGQLGTGNFISTTMPTAVLTTQRFRYLRAGPQFTCGLTVDNKVHCWGSNSYGELGRGTGSDSEPLPAAASNDLLFLSVRAGAGEHACAFLQGTTSHVCWGRSDVGQFGANGLMGLVMAATATCGTDGRIGACFGSIGGFLYNGEVLYHRGFSLAAGGQHACAYVQQVAAPSGWHCWGDNTFGQLGDGTRTSSRTPVQVRL